MPYLSRWEVAILACPDDAAYVDELSRALAPRARVFHAATIAPGEDRRRTIAVALDEALVIVVVGSRLSEHDRELAADAQAAIGRADRDPLARVVPVWRDDHAARPDRQVVYGLAAQQAIAPALAADVAATVVRIRAVLVDRRRAAHAEPRIAVVAVAAELAAEQRAVATRLRRAAPSSTVEEVDAAAPDSQERARAADFRVVLVGGRTGGTDTLARLHALDRDSLKLARPDFDAVPEHEVASAQTLRRSIADSFTTAEQAATTAQDRFARWLREWAPAEDSHDGEHRALHAWEKEYLAASLPGWREGAGNLRNHLERRTNRRIDRARLYVPLSAVPSPHCHVDEEGRLVVETSPEPSPAARRVPGGPPPIPGGPPPMPGGPPPMPMQRELGSPLLEQLVSHPALPMLVVEGEAGAGKTVLLQHVATVLAAQHLAEPAPATRLDLAALSAGAPILRVPILVEARALAERLTRGLPGELPTALAAIIRAAIGPALHASVTDDAVDQGLRAGRYLVLVDSLDEVPTIQGRRRVRDLVTALAARPTDAPASRLRLVLTTRPMAHTGLSVQGPGLLLVHIAPVDEEQRAAMADGWALAIGAPHEYRTELATALAELAWRHPRGEDERSLVENPQLLTCTFLVFDQHRLLPDSTAALYKRMVDILCDARAAHDLTAEQKRQLLEAVAEALQRGDGTTRAVEVLADELADAMPGLAYRDDRVSLLDRLADETGLLRFVDGADANGRPVRLVRLWHRSFQEYLTACRIASAPSLAETTDRLVRGEGGRAPVALDPAWEGTLTFLAGVHAGRRASNASDYLGRLFEHGRAATSPRVVGRLLGLAARGLAEYKKDCPDPRLRDLVRHEIARRFAESGRDWPLRDRLLALDALGRLGDPRFEVDPWVDIPGGVAVIGGDKEAPGSGPRREVEVAPFRMMWRPITVADFRPFVADDRASGAYLAATGVGDQLGFDPRDGYPGPDEWARQRFHPGRPVVNVSWFEAQAFCAWASAAWQLDVRLPTEVEWEHAARYPDGRVFPWGPEEPTGGDAAQANHSLQVGHASPVGAFPRGDKGRLVDLAGNVWEWCNDLWDPDARGDLGGLPRVVRGGSWLSRPWDLRCAFRDWSHPLDRVRYLGFRVVCGGARQP